MPRVCTVCAHSDRPGIDEALVSGTSLRNIAEQFGLAVSSLHRHKHGHVPVALAKARDAQKVADAEGLLGQIQKLTAEARKIKSMAEDKGDLRTALSAIRELVRMVELLAKLRGELDESPKVAVVSLPEWRHVVRVLDSYPQVRLEVARALESSDEVGRSM